MTRKQIFASLLAWMMLAVATALPMYADDGAPPATDASSAATNSGNPAVTDGGDPPITVGRLSGLAGKVSEEPAGVSQWGAAVNNTPISTGDRIYTDQDGRAQIEMGQTVAHVWHDTDMTMTNLTDQITQLGLSQGTLRLRTFGLDSNHAIEVDTPNGAITVMQPGSFRVDAYPADGGTQVTVNSGEVQITGPNFLQNINSGQSVRLTGTNPIQVATMDMPGRDAFDLWSQKRDQRILSARSSPYVNPNTVGSEDLNQYGSWSSTPNYGPIWYPTTVAPGWVPYSMGQWTWVAPWGWTWVDAEPWGFAPFHYGRWAMWEGRWGWVPGPYAMAPVYSPALVGWVGGVGMGGMAGAGMMGGMAGAGMGMGGMGGAGMGMNIGVGAGMGGMGLSAWFPLGPGEPFYPWYHYGPSYFSQVNVTNIYNYRSYPAIRNIGNPGEYNYYHSNAMMQNIHFVNRGVATIAMRQSAFASGARITPQTAIRPTMAQLRSAQWIPHPMVQPTMRSVVSHPMGQVPVSAMRPALLTQRGQQSVAPRMQMQQGTQISRPMMQSAPYRAQPQQQVQPMQQGNFAQQRLAGGQNFADGQWGGSRPLIIRNETPGPSPSFQQRQPAMSRDPGRPLDPWQVDNLSRGRPAGPARVPEFPSHPNYGGGFGGGGFRGGGMSRGGFGGGHFR